MRRSLVTSVSRSFVGAIGAKLTERLVWKRMINLTSQDVENVRLENEIVSDRFSFMSETVREVCRIKRLTVGGSSTGRNRQEWDGKKERRGRRRPSRSNNNSDDHVATSACLCILIGRCGCRPPVEVCSRAGNSSESDRFWVESQSSHEDRPATSGLIEDSVPLFDRLISDS